MSEYVTEFGSLNDFKKGGVEIIDDDPKNYVFSNVFEVARASAPYERVAVGKNFEYVIEAVRAEGTSPWYTAAHDEFALCMDGTIVVHLVKLDDPSIIGRESEGAIRLPFDPQRPQNGTHYPRGAAIWRFFPPARPTVSTPDTPSVAIVSNHGRRRDRPKVGRDLSDHMKVRR